MNLKHAIEMVCNFADNRLNGWDEATVVKMTAAIGMVRAIAKLKVAKEQDHHEIELEIDNENKS